MAQGSAGSYLVSVCEPKQITPHMKEVRMFPGRRLIARRRPGDMDDPADPAWICGKRDDLAPQVESLLEIMGDEQDSYLLAFLDAKKFVLQDLPRHGELLRIQEGQKVTVL